MAKKFIDGDYTPEQFRSMLANHCESSEETKYYRDLSEDDLVDKHKQLSKNLIKLNELEQDLKLIKDEYKDRMRPMVMLQKELLEAIHVKKELVQGTLFHVANQEDGVMETFTQDGEFHSSRKLRPDERQMRASFPLPKAVSE